MFASGVILSPGANSSLYEQGKANATSTLTQQVKLQKSNQFLGTLILKTVKGQEAPLQNLTQISVLKIFLVFQFYPTVS